MTPIGFPEVITPYLTRIFEKAEEFPMIALIQKYSSSWRETLIAGMKKELDNRMKEYSDYLLTKMWIESLKQNGIMTVTDEDVREYHKKHPVEVSADHILVGSPENAEDLLKKIRLGMGFAAAAKNFSLDVETSANGGKIAPFMYGEFLPDIEEVIFKMKTGEIQGVVKSKFGYHILRKNSSP